MCNTTTEVLDFVEENDIKFIRLIFCDLYGNIKNLAIMASELPRAFRSGVAFDASSVNGFTSVENSDLMLFPDPGTLAVLPWRPQEGRVARFYCDVRYSDGTPFEGDGRQLLRRAIERAAKLGYVPKIGSDADFYLFELDENGKPTHIPHDFGSSYDFAPLDKGENIRRDICLNLEQMGVAPECSVHENGPGQHMVLFKYGDALKAADDLTTFKSVVKTSAAQCGLYATFMPKPLVDKSGSGLHLNISLNKDGNDIFTNEVGKHSAEAESFIAGIMNRICEMTAILNPLPNSYKRFGTFKAPKYISWAKENRSQLVRIPPESGEHARMELRSPDLCCNQYVAFALLIEAGLDGIEQHETLQPAVDCDLYHAPQSVLNELKSLPRDLGEALQAMNDSEFVKRVMPQTMFQKYLTQKAGEWKCYEAAPDRRAFEFETYFHRV